MIQVCQKNYHLLKEKINFSPFLWFLSKIIENEKVLFSQMFRVWRKKFPPFQRKNEFLSVFVISSKITKTAKNRFFLLKHENFFWHTLIIWGNTSFSFRTLFMRISQTWLGTFRAHLFWPIFPHFFPLTVKKCPKYSCTVKIV